MAPLSCGKTVLASIFRAALSLDGRAHEPSALPLRPFPARQHLLERLGRLHLASPERHVEQIGRHHFAIGVLPRGAYPSDGALLPVCQPSREPISPFSPNNPSSILSFSQVAQIIQAARWLNRGDIRIGRWSPCHELTHLFTHLVKRSS